MSGRADGNPGRAVQKSVAIHILDHGALSAAGYQGIGMGQRWSHKPVAAGQDRACFGARKIGEQGRNRIRHDGTPLLTGQAQLAQLLRCGDPVLVPAA